MLRSLFSSRGPDEQGFGTRIVAMRTKDQAAKDKGGSWFQRVKIRRLGDRYFFTGEATDPPPGRENYYQGVVFWVPLSDVAELRVYESMEEARRLWEVYKRSPEARAKRPPSGGNGETQS